jgi:prevent-host-death family protein
MPIIKPISDLRNKTNHISDLVHKSHEPVFITKNGEGDMVLMSLAKYGEMERTLELYEKLAVAESQATAGNRGRPLDRVMADLWKKRGQATFFEAFRRCPRGRNEGRI